MMSHPFRGTYSFLNSPWFFNSECLTIPSWRLPFLLSYSRAEFGSVLLLCLTPNKQVLNEMFNNEDKNGTFLMACSKWKEIFTHESYSSSVTPSCPTLCDPMNHSMPGLPVNHQLPEFTQTRVHWVGGAIQQSHPLSSPSPPALNLSQHQSFQMSHLFASGGQNIGVSASSISPSNEYSYAIELFIMSVPLVLLWQTLQAVCKGILLNLLMISHLERVQS